MIYLDNAATTKPCGACMKAVCEAAENSFGNASSLHKMGTGSLMAISKAKAAVLNGIFLGRKPAEGEILFTSGATESNNTALLGVNLRGGNVVSTTIEHPSAARVLDKLEQRGVEVKRLSPKDFDDLEGGIIEGVNEKTALVSVMAVNNETGFAVDTERIYAAVKRKNPRAVVHVDGVQGFLKIPLYGDLVSVSGHKIHATKGIGALYIRKGVTINALLAGGGQQKNLRSGTEPVELIAGLEAAILDYKYDEEFYKNLKKLLVSGLEKIPDVVINSNEKCLANIVNFSVRGVRSEIMLHALEQEDILVSSGSACSKGKISSVPAAFGISDADADCAVRVSMCAENSTEEIELLCENIEKIARRVRR